MKLRYIPAVLVLFAVLMGGGYYALNQLRWLLRPVPHPCYVEAGSIATPDVNPIPENAPYLGSESITRGNAANLVLLHRTERFDDVESPYSAFNSDASMVVHRLRERWEIVDTYSGEIIWSRNALDTPTNVRDEFYGYGISDLGNFSLDTNEWIGGVAANAKCIAVGTSGGKIRFISRETTDRWTGTLAARHDVGNLTFSPDGMWLAYTTSGDNDSAGPALFSLWNLERHEEVFDVRLRSASSDGADLVFSPDSRLIAAAYHGYIDVYDVVTKARLFTLDDEAPRFSISVLAFNSDNSLLASGTGGGQVKLWDINTGELFIEFQIAYAVSALAFNHNSRNLLVIDDVGSVLYWGIE